MCAIPPWTREWKKRMFFDPWWDRPMRATWTRNTVIIGKYIVFQYGASSILCAPPRVEKTLFLVMFFVAAAAVAVNTTTNNNNNSNNNSNNSNNGYSTSVLLMPKLHAWTILLIGSFAVLWTQGCPSTIQNNQQCERMLQVLYQHLKQTIRIHTSMHATVARVE